MFAFGVHNVVDFNVPLIAGNSRSHKKAGFLNLLSFPSTVFPTSHDAYLTFPLIQYLFTNPSP